MMDLMIEQEVQSSKNNKSSQYLCHKFEKEFR